MYCLISAYPSGRWNINPHTLSDLHIVTSFQKVQKGKKQNNLTRSHDKQYLSQMSEVTINSHSSCWYYIPLICLRMSLDYCFFPQNTHNHSPITGRTLDESQLRDILQIIWPIHCNIVKFIENNGSLKLKLFRERET